MPTFKYDGREIPFEPGESIIKAAARQGIEIPHYCWHPGLSAPANCRMCLVEIAPPAGQRPMLLDILEWDASVGDYRPTKKPKLQPACQMAAQDGMDVRGETSEEVKKARGAVQEFLLLNHPVDCPICDQSGECKLQDYWLEHGRFQKRMRDEPVHKPKAVEFGSTIVYDAERCVMCTRCIRFMEEVAKDPVLEMRERGNLNEIMVAPGRQLEGKYTFMTEHVCPVGALTTKDFRFKARVWFLRTASSVCQGCATGCNTHLDFDPRYNKAHRYRPRDNEAVNKYWMCDDGMVTYKEAHEHRVTEPRVGGNVVTEAQAHEELRRRFQGVPHSSIAVILSAQHSLEDNWAMVELGATLFGSKALYWSGRGAGYADDILIAADKNSNTLGVAQLAPTAKPFATFMDDVKAGRVTHVVALGGSTPGRLDDDGANLADATTLVTIAAHEGALTKAADIVLPACSWAEASGTFVNAKGLRQVADKALEPMGASRPAWEHAAKVGQSIGVEASWSKLKEVRAAVKALLAPSSSSVHAAPPTASA
ncbi:MAG: (2Fe-2S)-binding protein [Myxococcales bacterium]|nr:(2Fe-2S)-binding protein [Myxococcales bacterium]